MTSGGEAGAPHHNGAGKRCGDETLSAKTAWVGLGAQTEQLSRNACGVRSNLDCFRTASQRYPLEVPRKFGKLSLNQERPVRNTGDRVGVLKMKASMAHKEALATTCQPHLVIKIAQAQPSMDCEIGSP